MVNDLRNAEGVVNEIRALGSEAVAHTGSATDGKQIINAAIEAFGRVDVIVSNAGFLRDKTLAKMEDSSWDAVVDVHLNGMYQLAKAAWPHVSVLMSPMLHPSSREDFVECCTLTIS